MDRFQHPKANVGAIYLRLTPEMNPRLLELGSLATDSLLAKSDFYPREELLCLGCPFGAELNSTGFPILKSGRHASY